MQEHVGQEKPKIGKGGHVWLMTTSVHRSTRLRGKVNVNTGNGNQLFVNRYSTINLATETQNQCLEKADVGKQIKRSLVVRKAPS